MLKLILTKLKALLHTQNNVENNHKPNSLLVENRPIKGTPFRIRKENNNWFLTLGDYRITENSKTEEETLQKLETEKWLIMMHVAIIAQESAKKYEQLPPEEKQQYEKQINY